MLCFSYFISFAFLISLFVEKDQQHAARKWLSYAFVLDK
jgi:hypothetical protein